MARMPDQLPAVRAPRGRPAATMPADSSSGLGELGRALGAVAEVETEKRLRLRDADDAAALAAQTADFRARHTERLLSEADALEDAAVDGFSDRFAASVETDADAEIARLPERLRAQARAWYAGAQSDFRLRGREVEHGRRVERQGRLLDAQVRGLGAAVFADATQYPSVLDEGLAAIEASALPEAAQARARDALPGVLANQRLLGLIDRDPYAARDELEAGDWDGVLEVADLARHLDAAKREIERREAEAERRRLAALARAQASLRVRLEDNLASIAATGQGIQGLTPTVVARTFGEEAAEAYFAQVRQAETDYTTTSRWRFMSPDEIETQVERERPRPGQDGFVAAQERWARLAELAQGELQRRFADPAAAAAAADPVLGQRLAGLASADPASRRTILAELSDRQDRLGIPRGGQRLTSNAQALAWAAQLRGAGAENAASALEQVNREVTAIYGAAAASQALAEIAEVGELPALGQMAAGGSEAERRRIAVALTSPEPELTQQQTRRIGETLRAEFAGLRQALAHQPLGLARLEQAYDVARRDAALAVAAGRSPAEAAREAAQLYTRRYHQIDGRVVPRSLGGRALPRGEARALLDEAERRRAEILDAGGYYLPAGPEDLADADLERRRRDSAELTLRWVNAPDDGGLILFDLYSGQAVRRSETDERPIALSWQALAASRAARRARESEDRDTPTVRGRFGAERPVH